MIISYLSPLVDGSLNWFLSRTECKVRVDTSLLRDINILTASGNEVAFWPTKGTTTADLRAHLLIIRRNLSHN